MRSGWRCCCCAGLCDRRGNRARVGRIGQCSSSGASSGEHAGHSAAGAYLVRAGGSFDGSGDFVDAELRFKEFLLQYPDYPGAHVNLAIIHSNNGNEAAARHQSTGIGAGPDHPAALNQMGMLLRRNGKFLEAEAAYMKAVTVSPEYALAHYNLGVLNELYLQRLDTALQHFRDLSVTRWRRQAS